MKSSLEQTQKNLIQSILQPKNKSQKTGLSIYQTAYKIRLLESLSADFSLTQKILGKKSFQKIILKYIYNSPSQFSDLLDYSNHLPQFVKSQKEYNKVWPWLVDFLNFEILLNKTAFHHKDSIAQTQITEDTKIYISPSLCILKTRYDFDLLIQKRKVKRKATLLRVSASQNKSNWKELSPAEYKFLNKLQALKKPLKIKNLNKYIPKSLENSISDLFSEWVQEGVIELYN